MDRVAIDLGFIKIYYYSLCILIAILTALFIIEKERKKEKIEEDFFWDLAFKVILIGIVGARIYYVLFNPTEYLKNPIEIFQVWKGGLAIHGGLLAGLGVIFYTCKKEKQNPWKLLDIIVPGVMIAQSIGRWGNFFNQEAYGRLTTRSHLISLKIPNFIIDGMKINGNYYEPTFFYESILSLIGFIIIISIRKRKQLKIGELFSFYLIWYGIVRIWIESMRSDSLMLGNIKVAQLISLLFIISGIVGIIIIQKKFKKSKKKDQKKYYYHKEGEQNA